MTKRSLRHIRHDPEQLVNVTVQPVLIVVLMDVLFGGAIKTGTHGSYINFVMPGILVVTAAFAAVTIFLLVTLALSLLAALIGLLGKSVEVTQQLAAIIIIPIFFSSALVPAGTMPSWLRVVTANQPVTQAVDTLRALLLNQPPSSHNWLTLTEFGGIVVAAFTLATILFMRTAS